MAPQQIFLGRTINLYVSKSDHPQFAVASIIRWNPILQPNDSTQPITPHLYPSSVVIAWFNEIYDAEPAAAHNGTTDPAGSSECDGVWWESTIALCTLQPTAMQRTPHSSAVSGDQ